MFPWRWSCDACRCSVRPFPPCICGCSGTLLGCLYAHHNRDPSHVPSQFPKARVNGHASPALLCRLRLEFREFTLHHVHLPLASYARHLSLLTAFSHDAMCTAPFRALPHSWGRLTLVGTEDLSTSGSSLLLVFDLCGCLLLCLQARRHPWEHSKIPSTLSSSRTPGSAGNPLGTLPVGG